MTALNYGFLGGRRMKRLAPIPHAHEVNVIARAQSILTSNGMVGPVLPYEDAKRVVRRAEGKSRVTVPPPNMPASAPSCASPA